MSLNPDRLRQEENPLAEKFYPEMSFSPFVGHVEAVAYQAMEEKIPDEVAEFCVNSSLAGDRREAVRLAIGNWNECVERGGAFIEAGQVIGGINLQNALILSMALDTREELKVRINLLRIAAENIILEDSRFN